jgi:hypothetical protein
VIAHLVQADEDAVREGIHRSQQLGAWDQFGQDLLLGYEYRACMKLGARELPDPAEAID